MVGQHLFMRCWDEQDSAGTWTAAVSAGVLERNAIREELEPRCNLEEVFAQQNMLECSSNNILRMYPLNGGAIAVSRTYWESDRITDSSGRKGAYTVSFIITGNDVDTYCRDFTGAFDELCFESYASVIDRMQTGGTRRVTLDPRFDIFSHRSIAADFRAFQEAGFDKEDFILLMEGLYGAVEHNGKLAVVLPEGIRKAWTRTGGDLTERLMMAIMCLLPPQTRRKVGMVSHWDCTLRESMLRGMHLVFVHPSNENEMQELYNKGILVLNVGVDKKARNIPDVAPNYFSFLWETMEDREKREAVWHASEVKYGDVVARMPASAAAVECAFLFERTEQLQYADPALCRAAYTASSKVFAGAGNRFPVVDRMICSCLAGVEKDNESVEPSLGNALMQFVVRDQTNTEHQALEYERLFHQIERENVSNEVVEALVSEIGKKDRAAAPFFADYLMSREGLDETGVTLAMVRFVSGVFSALVDSEEQRYEKLQKASLAVMNRWGQRLEQAGRWGVLAPIIGVYADSLKKTTLDVETLHVCYKWLFRGSLCNDEKINSLCENELLKEERRLYKAPELLVGQGETRIETLCQEMADVVGEVDQGLSCVGGNGYKRLYRLYAFGRKEPAVLERLYCKMAKYCNELGASTGALTAFFEAQYAAVKEMRGAGSIWKEENIRRSVIDLECVLQEALSDYCPTAKRITFLLNVFGSWDKDICRLFVQYLQRVSTSQREEIYRILKDAGRIGCLYVYALIDPATAEYKDEFEPYVDLSSEAKLRMIVETKLVEEGSAEEERLKSSFGAWYASELGQRLNEQRGLVQKLELLNNESALLRELGESGGRLVPVAVAVFNDSVRTELVCLKRGQVVQLPPKAVAVLGNMVSAQATLDRIDAVPVIRIVSRLDSLSEDRLVYYLDKFTASRECEEYRDYVIERLDYYILSLRSKAENLELAWKYELFRALLLDKGRSFVYNISMGEMESEYRRMDDRERAELLLSMMEALDYKNAVNQRRVFHDAIVELCRIAQRSPAIVRELDMRERFSWMKCLTSDEQRAISKRIGHIDANDSGCTVVATESFGVLKVLWCVLGAIASLLVFAGMLLVLHFINRVSTVAAILTSFLFALVLLIVYLGMRRTAAKMSRG